MKHLSLLIWLTQFGISVAAPPVCFIALTLWLRDSCGWGPWVLWVGIGLGVFCAIDGLRASIQAMLRMAKNHDPADEDTSPGVCFNEHD